jgi:hypothetical protein
MHAPRTSAGNGIGEAHPTQVPISLDELSFIADMLNYPLAHGSGSVARHYLVARLTRPSWDGSVTVDGD